MKKNKQPDGMPVWFDGKSINEALFCEEFCIRRRPAAVGAVVQRPLCGLSNSRH